VAIAAVTAAELLVGVELADDAHQPRRTAFVHSVLTTIPVEDYTLPVARAHALLLAHVPATGRMRGPHDLIIAATASATGRTVVSTDAAAFADLPGVSVIA
jgi:tRNA(fMet)-specific endonuclease VapC